LEILSEAAADDYAATDYATAANLCLKTTAVIIIIKWYNANKNFNYISFPFQYR